jgi:hypothetical protein
MFNFFAYAPSYTGGVRVAVGDVNGDSVPDIITGAASSVSHVKVFSGANGAEIRSFLAFGSATLGVFVAAGDINGDGFADIIVGADAPGPPHVKAFSGRDSSELRSFFAYGAGFTGGVRVAAGDINGDGRADIITGAGSAGSTHVKVFSGADNSDLASFLSFSGFSGGVFVGSPVPVGPGATVRGLTFLDSNADGKLTAGEPAFPSVTLFIDGNQNGAPDNGELTISSGGNGSFGVTNLAPGSYAFQQLPPPGYFSTVPNPQFVSLAPGQVKTGVDFGLHGAPRLSINLLSGKAVLSWPSFASSFQLEYATNVVGDVWLPSQERPALSGGFYVVTQSVSGARSFFRLRE